MSSYDMPATDMLRSGLFPPPGNVSPVDALTNVTRALAGALALGSAENVNAARCLPSL
jgi:hypothetical protein